MARILSYIVIAIVALTVAMIPFRDKLPRYTEADMSAARIQTAEAIRDSAQRAYDRRIAALSAIRDSIQQVNAELAARPPVKLIRHDTTYLYVPDSSAAPSLAPIVIPTPVAQRLALLERKVPLLEAENDSLRSALALSFKAEASTASVNTRLREAVARAEGSAHKRLWVGVAIGAISVAAAQRIIAR